MIGDVARRGYFPLNSGGITLTNNPAVHAVADEADAWLRRVCSALQTA